MSHVSQDKTKKPFKREALLANVYKATGLAKLPGAVEYIGMLLDGGVNKVLIFAHHLDVLDGIYI